MVSKEQKIWLSKLSETKLVEIKPYDPEVKNIFQRQKAELMLILGSETEVFHEGASAWGISGKGDIDIYIPVVRLRFNESVATLVNIYGDPESHYPYDRARWNREKAGTEIEIFITNRESVFWENSLIFWNYIKTHPETLEAYRTLKEEAAGTSIREYYTRKTIFINQVMDMAKKKK